MRVISVGTNNRIKCEPGCGSVLEFTPQDVFLRHQPIKVGPWEIECMPEPEDHYQGQVSCPVCKNLLRVNVSREFKRQLLNREKAREYD